jgi:Uma2 family endonuclease
MEDEVRLIRETRDDAMTTPSTADTDIEYPDQDGRPMSDNTLQFRWITTLQGNLDAMFLDDPNVFVAGDLLWYPVEGHPEIRTAPDAMVVFGRPKGYRGSYRQWREGGIAPQVVFEVLSPGNRPEEMDRKLAFYDRYGVEEYYLYDPDGQQLGGWVRQGRRLQAVPDVNGWISPRLGIRFDMAGDDLLIHRPDGQRFLTFVELKRQQEHAQHLTVEAQRLALEAQRMAGEAQRQAVEERAAREEAERRAARLAERLRELGINPDA